jgi:hypothetical protein
LKYKYFPASPSHYRCCEYFFIAGLLRQRLQHLRDEIYARESSNKRIAIALALILGFAAGIAGSYFVTGEQVTNVIFCDQDAVRA